MAESVANRDDPHVGGREVGPRPQADQLTRVAVLADEAFAAYDKAAMSGLAMALATLGVRPNERVLIVIPDGPGFEEAIIGTIWLGAVPLPVNPVVSAGDLVMVAGEAGSRLAVIATQHTRVLTELHVDVAVPVDGPKGPWVTAVELAEPR